MATQADPVNAAEMLARLEAVEARLQLAELTTSEAVEHWRAIAVLIAAGFAVTALLLLGSRAGLWVPLSWAETPTIAGVATAFLLLTGVGHICLWFVERRHRRQRWRHSTGRDADRWLD